MRASWYGSRRCCTPRSASPPRRRSWCSPVHRSSSRSCRSAVPRCGGCRSTVFRPACRSSTGAWSGLWPAAAVRRVGASSAPSRGAPMPRIDLDRGNMPVPVGKRPEMLDPNVKDERDQTRDGLRELDRMVEARPDLSRFRRDEERAHPRHGTGVVRHRRPPADTEPRRLTAYRQKMLNKQKTALDRDRLPVRPRRAFAAVFTDDPSELAGINDLLATHVGDIDVLDEATARTVRRVDRVIRMAEAHNVADNIVYTPIRPPDAVNSGNVRDWLNRNFAAGTEVTVDRYTITSHHAAQPTAAARATGGCCARSAPAAAPTSAGTHQHRSAPQRRPLPAPRPAAALRGHQHRPDQPTRRHPVPANRPATGGPVMTSDRTATDGPRPEGPDLFTRYAAPAGLLDWAFGPAGRNPAAPPHPTRPGTGEQRVPTTRGRWSIGGDGGDACPRHRVLAPAARSGDHLGTGHAATRGRGDPGHQHPPRTRRPGHRRRRDGYHRGRTCPRPDRRRRREDHPHPGPTGRYPTAARLQRRRRPGMAAGRGRPAGPGPRAAGGPGPAGDASCGPGRPRWAHRITCTRWAPRTTRSPRSPRPGPRWTCCRRSPTSGARPRPAAIRRRGRPR